MTEQEYKQHRKKENSLYLWFNVIDFLSKFINAALIGSAITLIIIKGFNSYMPLALMLLSIAVLLLGHETTKILKDKWEYEFSICANYMGEKLIERMKEEDERKD